ncbi:MAG: helix-turn-helix domain-containing protein [Novosphingobium sp.]
MPTRKRLSQEESRWRALEAARELLIELGPQAVTLKAVAARVGRTHANLLHHFGSASGLQKALASFLANAICARIGEAVIASRTGSGSPREVVDLTFDAFDSGGAGALASWMLLSGNEDALDPIVEAIHDLVDDIKEYGSGSMREITLTLVLMAMGDAQMGGSLSHALGLPRTTARDMAERMLVAAAEGPVLPIA